MESKSKSFRNARRKNESERERKFTWNCTIVHLASYCVVLCASMLDEEKRRDSYQCPGRNDQDPLSLDGPDNRSETTLA